MPRRETSTNTRPDTTLHSAADQEGTDIPSQDEVPERESVSESDREEQIRKAAYARFEARGDAPGSAEQDWLDAESDYAALDARSPS